MLTLERKAGEKIVITHGNETLELTVTILSKGKVKLNFDGPETFEIWRDEVLPEI